MLASIESLFIFLIFVALSALSAWLQKRRENRDGEEVPWPSDQPQRGATRPTPRRTPPQGNPTPEGPAPPTVSSWEQELRRLLEGVRPSAPEPSRPPPVVSPPVVVQTPAQRPRSAPPPLQPAPVAADATPRLEQSLQAYRQARARQAEAAALLREAQVKTAGHPRTTGRARHSAPATDIAASRQLISNPRSARQAIVASIILAPPKALQ